MSEPANAQVSVQTEWEEVLRRGPRGLLVRGPVGYRLAPRVMRRFPADARCKNCNVPFTGVIGRVAAALGFGRSRKNPQMCRF